jgi:trimethylamine:corrinoid methyltransferase-like protein
MGGVSVQILITLSIMVAVGVPVFVAAVSHHMRDSQSGHESAMTVAMSVGMMAGLTLGIVAGLLAPADLWPPTAVGVVAGIAG